MTRSKRVMITQSNYIPWKGYFDSIHQVDEFVIYDDVQYTKRDWRNRNRIKTPQGLHWLTIPVQVSGKYFQSIQDTRVEKKNWGEKHWKTLLSSYSQAPYFEDYAAELERLYLRPESDLLSETNQSFLRLICGWLGIQTQLKLSQQFQARGEKTEKLLNICLQTHATDYFTGPAAKAYLDERAFERAGIGLHYFDYSDYPEYPQLHGGFIHEVSVLDLLFNTGKSAPQYLKTFQKNSRQVELEKRI